MDNKTKPEFREPKDPKLKKARKDRRVFSQSIKSFLAKTRGENIKPEDFEDLEENFPEDD